MEHSVFVVVLLVSFFLAVFPQSAHVLITTGSLFHQEEEEPPHPLWLLSIRVLGSNLLLLSVVAWKHAQGYMYIGVVVATLLFQSGKCVDAHYGNLGVLFSGLAFSVPVFLLAYVETLRIRAFRIPSEVQLKRRGTPWKWWFWVGWITFALLAFLFSFAEIFPELCWKLNLWPAEANAPPVELAPKGWLDTLRVAGVARLVTNLMLLKLAACK